jgi:hypothetical protein
MAVTAKIAKSKVARTAPPIANDGCFLMMILLQALT